jgi:hypothetical protein
MVLNSNKPYRLFTSIYEFPEQYQRLLPIGHLIFDLAKLEFYVNYLDLFILLINN